MQIFRDFVANFFYSWLVNETGPKNAEVLRNMAYSKANGAD